MSWQMRWSLALLVLMQANSGLPGQTGTTGQPAGPKKMTTEQPAAPKNDFPPPPAAGAVAATVNGQVISEMSVYRSIVGERALRQEILEHLIENALIDQYLIQLKIPVEPKEVDEKFNKIKSETEKEGGLEKVLKANFITEAEMRAELTELLRWDRFVTQQSTDATLKEFFTRNTAIFDGSQVRARHILIKIDQGLTREVATAHLLQLKKWIEDETQRELARLSAEERTDKRSAEILEKNFADVAMKQSACPSKERGGDLKWFPRAGMMVEPFARAAFALKPYQMSEVVVTPYGYHLIMTVDRKSGKDVTFEEVKSYVREAYSDRLRDAVIQAMRPNARITIHPAGK